MWQIRFFFNLNLIKYLYILVILYNLNLLLTTFVNLMVKNITLFNYKNTVQFTKNKFFFDIIIEYYNYNNTFAKFAIATARENSLMVKPQSSKLLL